MGLGWAFLPSKQALAGLPGNEWDLELEVIIRDPAQQGQEFGSLV